MYREANGSGERRKLFQQFEHIKSPENRSIFNRLFGANAV